MLDTEERREAMRPTIANAKMAFINVGYAHYYQYKHVWAILGEQSEEGHQYLDYKLDDEYDLKERMLFRKEIEIAFYGDRPFIIVPVGFTQTYINLNIAYWMGFTTALMVGIDHDFGSPDRHFYKDDEIESFHLSSERTGEEAEQAYRLEIGADWAYSQARKAYEEDGRQILNLTPGSKAKALEFGRLEEWL